MKIVFSFLLFIAFSASANTITPQELRHLLFRTSFSPDSRLVKQFQNLSYKQAVNKIIADTSISSSTPTPKFTQPLYHDKRFKELSIQQRKQINKQRRAQGLQLKAWWINEMIQTPTPLTEVMTLFWHNHFTSSLKKVKYAKLMLDQNKLLRQHALGNFADMLHAIAQDPAMLIYLDTVKNKKKSPNENFARELMELFTLGEGHYTENDIKQAAIAFTGWSVQRKTGQFVFRKKQHNNQAITLFNQTINAKGKDAGDEVLELLLQQEQTAVYLSEKLYRYFVSAEQINEDTVQHLALVLRQNHYEIKPWLTALLLSDDFKQQQLKGSLIKSPIDLIVGTFRSLNLPTENPKLLAKASRRLGQDLFQPPNVKGWLGYTNWINTDTLLKRQQMSSRLLREQAQAMSMMTVQQKDSLLATQLTSNKRFAQQILDPAYQVK